MNIILKKLVREYVYCSETLEDVKNISSSAEGEFRNALRDLNQEALSALAKPNSGKTPEKKEDDSVTFNDKDFKKLFRKLAVKCHPDKLGNIDSDREKEFLKRCYEQINIANDTYDWGLLLKVAIDLKIDIPELSNETIDNIKENTEKLKKAIEKYESSMAYQWFFMDDENIKNSYLEQCANAFLKSIRPNDQHGDI